MVEKNVILPFKTKFQGGGILCLPNRKLTLTVRKPLFGPQRATFILIKNRVPDFDIKH